MPFLFNCKKYRHLRQKLRRERPITEIILWEYLRKSRFYGYKFRRQQGIGRYIVDLYCPKLELAIELDGNSHFEPNQIAYDRVRQDWIESYGIKIIRFYNHEVLEDLEGVLIRLKDVCDARNRTTPDPS